MTLITNDKDSVTGCDVVEEMGHLLRDFGANQDRRIVFLHAYWIISKRVMEAVRLPPDKNPFLDAQWVEKLMVTFADLYLRTIDERQLSVRPWSYIHHLAQSSKTTVLQDLLLGINIHINFDLPVALMTVLKGEPWQEHSHLIRRRFDHRQINVILESAIDHIQDELANYYGGAIGALDRLMARNDERIASLAVRFFREETWDYAISLCATSDQREQKVIRHRMEGETMSIAQSLGEPKGFILSMLLKSMRAFRRKYFTGPLLPASALKSEVLN
ncbi:MAG: DUF5995 family protein [Myxococcota bacterium]|nr:DUF5995 family protein [Myxococcota bacterium]